MGVDKIMNKREIKFRVWDKNEKTMINFEEIERIDFTDKTIIVGGYISFEDIEFMQYTGLKDKNDKEIYRGDILERKFKGLGYELGDRTLVGWDKYKYVHIWKMEFERELKNNQDLGRWFKSRKISELDLDAHIEDFEVIGNIYENPELLN
ncbi:hypothetical protein JJB47_11730 [Clostridium perfringens]|jgi:uncharacterized phage protein (TIGR01671 family)|uniref:YopX protein domain-containing protein n=2 Tax=Clostridium perfringens TaxID=1502 RepID=A0AAW4J5X2_CLOPF|nr:hypothetical protein [Clostridium perfringens]